MVKQLGLPVRLCRVKCTIKLIAVVLLVLAQLSAKKTTPRLDPAGIQVYDQYQKSTGFYVFTPDSIPQGDTLGLVVFLHGYGALNPLNYGAWIRQVVEAGNAVIYPRYQKSILLSQPKKFASNAAEGIRGGLDLINVEQLPVDTSKVTYLGHSYGGTLSAFMMAKEDSLGLPKAYGGLLAAPGTSKLSGSRLPAYSDISADAQLVIVTHEGDHTVGSEFAKLVHTTALETSKRVWIRQAEQTVDTFSISQGHNECYALDMSFDSGYRNFTTKRALRIGRTDVIDHNLYWPLSLELIASAKTQGVVSILAEHVPQYEFGHSPSGTPLSALPVLYGSSSIFPAEREKDGQ